MSPTPVIEVTMAISHPIISLSAPEDCSLTITATLQHKEPITLYTWPHIFNLSLAQRRFNFSCVDITPGNDQEKPYINTHSAGHVNKMGAISRQLGSVDDQFWVTFQPDQPVSFTEKFSLATRKDQPLKPGHRYRYAILRRWLIQWKWQAGTREDLMTTEHAFVRGPAFMPLTIVFPYGDSVEFEVEA